MRALILAPIFVLSLAGGVRADPCDFIPDRGPTPDAVRSGRVFTGPVVHVIDGDGLCVDIGAQAASARGANVSPGENRVGAQAASARGASVSPGVMWVEVRLADFYAPELAEPGGPAARDALSGLALGRTVRCVAGRRSWDRVVARCTLDGRTLGDLMREAGVVEGGRGR